MYDLAEFTGEYSGLTEILVIAGLTGLGGLIRVFGGLNLVTARVWGAIGGGFGLAEVAIRYSNLKRLGPVSGLVDLRIGFYLLAFGAASVLIGAYLDTDM